MIAEKIAINFQKYFDEDQINKTARQTQFEKRSARKMSASEFFKLLIFSNLNTKDVSLDNLCETFEVDRKISFTKQSLDEKFDTESVEFIKKLLFNLIEHSILETNLKFGDILENFESVRIKDSTSFKLSKNMANKYIASSKNKEHSILKIQYEFDLKTGKVYDLSLHSFIESDLTDAKTNIENINKNDLFLRDLGYVVLPVMEAIIKKEAFFLNRFAFSSNAYETETSTQKIDFAKIQEYLKKYRLQSIEKNVFIGNKQRIPVRMIIEILPESEIEKRLRKLKRQEIQCRKVFSKEYRAHQILNVFVTNIPKEKLAIENVRHIYRLRWQIEIIFKIWKTIGKIEQTKKMKTKRFETMFYAKLILLLLCQNIYWNTTYYVELYQNKSLSIFKTFKTIINNLKEIKIGIKQGVSAIIELFKVLIKIIKEKGKLEKKKNTISSKEIMQLYNIAKNEK